MSSAKLLKKDELNMSTGIKNGKHHTINIYILVILTIISGTYGLNAADTGEKKDGKWVIVIDPGHGGNDPGALGAVNREKDINLAIALKTGTYLSEYSDNINVIFTRNKDTFVELIERPRIANKNNADLFISIHTNWAKSKSVIGAETYIMGLAKDQENLEVAMKENEVILLEDDYSTKYQGFDPKSPESYIIFTLMQNVFQKQSTELAAKIQNQFTERVNRKDRGVKQAGFWVLFNTTMPSVLVETGFITNQSEEKFLSSKEGQDYMASAIFRAIKEYMSEIDMKSGINIQENKQIKDTTPAPANKPGLSVSPSGSPATGIEFRVQVATSSNRIKTNPENFKGLSNISEISTQGRFRYTTGTFSEYSDAVEYRKKIESIYPDAFVIAVKDNKVLPLQQALDQKRKK